ncbi:MAG: hypothetical protein ACK4S4_08430 [Pyrinomonadaceae bacterium]
MNSLTSTLLHRAESSPDGDTSVNFAERKFADEASARDAFAQVRERLLDLRHWNECSGLSNYDLFDEGGTLLTDTRIETGRFIRILLHGTGKYDWVRVERVVDDADELVITVSPTFDPTASERDRKTTSHFFASTASNNFCLVRDGARLAMYVVGLGEKQNVSEAGGVIESARNAAVANLGYYLGVQKAEWTKFCSNFVESVKGAD